METIPKPPPLLQIFRERVKPGSEGAYREVEEDTARLGARLGCPHPYLGIESLTGPREVWFFNGYESAAEHEQVVAAYANNHALLAALESNGKRKASLTVAPAEVFASHRPDLSRGVAWSLGQGRFLVITVTTSDQPSDGTCFVTAEGTRFIVTAAGTREDADARAAARVEARVFAVRPRFSVPAPAWIAADPAFWTTES
jgi:hypothetical protein